MAKVLSKEEWKKRKKLYAYLKLVVAAMLALLIVLILLIGLIKVVKNLFSKGSPEAPVAPTMKQELDITELFLTPNGYTRPQNPLKEVKGIVIHYVANSGSSAVENRNYYTLQRATAPQKQRKAAILLLILTAASCSVSRLTRLPALPVRATRTQLRSLFAIRK